MQLGAPYIQLFGAAVVNTYIVECAWQVGKPQEVKDAEQASSPVSDDTILKVITAFNVGVGKYTKLVRRLLPAYGGYECKEPESGKFTLSFRYD